MLRQETYLFRRANQAVDALLSVVALVAAHYVGQKLLRPYVFPTLIARSHLSSHAWVFVAFPVFILLFQQGSGLYDPAGYRSLWRIVGRSVLAVAATAAAAAGISYVSYDRGVVSRALVLGGAVWLAALLAIKGAVVRRLLRAARARGRFRRRLLLVGSGKPLRQFVEQARDHPLWGFEIAGIVSDDDRHTPGQKVVHAPVVARLGGLVEYLEKNSVDEVIFIPEKRPLADLRAPLEACELMGIKTRLSLSFFEQRIGFARPQVDEFEGTAVVTYSPAREVDDWRLLLKYGFDRVAAALLLLLLSPLFIALAAAVKAGGRWRDPVFYGQPRSGLNGRPFVCWKFRSMYPDADKRLAELAGDNEMTGPVFKMKDDPRVTPVGRLLRRTSLDELPQLWNVLMGEMSLVGPRPPIPAEVARYDLWQRRRLSMKPGITCIWQVSGRNLIDFETWMKMDLEYIDRWSLWLDAKILARTAWVVLTGYGAM